MFRKVSSVIFVMIVFIAVSGNSGSAHAQAQKNALTNNRDGFSFHSGNQHFINVAETKLHYVEAGRGQAVVMIHGNAGYVQDFEFGTIDMLSNGFRAIAFDRPGHGLSDLPKSGHASVEEQAAILHQALGALGIKNPILVGHSWGAAVALAYGIQYPQETAGLVLLAPVAYNGGGHDSGFSKLLRTPILGDLSLGIAKPFIARRMLSDSLKEAFYPDAVPEEYQRAAEKVWLGRKQLKAFARDDLALDDSLRRLASRYQEMRLPVMIVTGDKDKVISAEQNAVRLHQAVAGSQLMVIKNGGHQIPETHPEAVLRAVEQLKDSLNNNERSEETASAMMLITP
jgi:pimeloyl-ACP methyl ester carboxylesterase